MESDEETKNQEIKIHTQDNIAADQNRRMSPRLENFLRSTLSKSAKSSYEVNILKQLFNTLMIKYLDVHTCRTEFQLFS